MEVLGLEGNEMPANGEGPAAVQETPAPGDVPLLDSGIEMEAGPYEAAPSENGAGAPGVDEPLDPGLVRLFLEANAEAQESAAAADLPDIPIQDLLNDLMSLSRSLGIADSRRAETVAEDQVPELDHPTLPEAAVPPSHNVWMQALRGLALSARSGLEGLRGLAPRPLLLRVGLGLGGLRRLALSDLLPMARPRLPASRRHAMHGILLILTLVMAIASVLIGVDRMISSEQNQGLRPEVTATAPSSGVVVRQAEPTLEPAPAPTATREPAYFLYTVQRGDTLTDIAIAFGLNLDHMLWANPEHIDDPDLLHVGDRLLIPSLEGMIYFVKPGDILSAMGRLLPAPEPADPGSPTEQSEPPE